MIRLLQAASNPTLLSQHSQEFEVPPLTADGTSLVELIEKYSQFEVPAKFEAAISLTKKLLSEGKKVLLWTSFVHNINDKLNEKFETMKKVLEEEIPVGTFDVEGYEMEQTESEEKADFDATVADVKRFLKKGK